MHNWEQPQRQAKAGFLIMLYKTTVIAIKAVWPVLIVFLFKKNEKESALIEILLIASIVFVFTGAIIKFLYYRFFIKDNNFIIKKGLFVKKTITLPLEKIQGVNIEQPFLHQLLQIAKVKIDTAGSDTTEGEIDSLSLSAATELKEFLLEQKKDKTITHTAEAVPTPIPILQLSFSDLVKLGLSANHIKTLLLVIGFVISFYQNIHDVFSKKAEQLVESSVSGLEKSMSLIIYAAMAIIVMLLAGSVIKTIVVYFQFSIYKTAKGFVVKHGLLNRKEFIIPFNKVQMIIWEANFIRRKIGLYNLRFKQVAGDAEKMQRKQPLKIPVTNIANMEPLLQPYHPQIKQEAPAVYTIDKAYIYRRTLFFGMVPAILISTGCYFFIDWPALFFLLWVPCWYLSEKKYRQNFKLFVTDGALQTVSGVWGRKEQLLQWYKIQQTSISQTIYQRRKQLASLHLKTAGGVITIPYIALEQANQLTNYALYKIESCNEEWM
jgi:putative membrane protein